MNSINISYKLKLKIYIENLKHFFHPFYLGPITCGPFSLWVFNISLLPYPIAASIGP